MENEVKQPLFKRILKRWRLISLTFIILALLAGAVAVTIINNRDPEREQEVISDLEW